MAAHKKIFTTLVRKNIIQDHVKDEESGSNYCPKMAGGVKRGGRKGAGGVKGGGRKGAFVCGCV